MSWPKTYDDWWRILDENWEELLSILADKLNFDFPAYDPPGRADGTLTGRSIGVELEHLRKNRDGERLARYLFAAWDLASEAYAWSVPGWGVLCDLLSEEYVLYETGEEAIQ